MDDPSGYVDALFDERSMYARSAQPSRMIAVDEELARCGWVVNTTGNLVRVDQDRRVVTADPDAAKDAAKAAAADAKEADRVKAEADKAAAEAADAKAAADESARQAAVDQRVAEGRAEADEEDEPVKKSRRPRERAVTSAPEKAVDPD